MKALNEKICQSISAGNIPVEYIGPDEMYSGVHRYRLPTKQIVCLGPKGICINTEDYGDKNQSLLVNIQETQPSSDLGTFFTLGLLCGVIGVLKAVGRSS